LHKNDKKNLLAITKLLSAIPLKLEIMARMLECQFYLVGLLAALDLLESLLPVWLALADFETLSFVSHC